MIKSTQDYEGWKQQVTDDYVNKFPNKAKYVAKFMDYVDTSLKPFNRTFISQKVMWYLYERRLGVKKNQHYWVAFIGRKGGEGKSTLGKHILYFMDNTFTPDPINRCPTNYLDFVKAVKKLKQVDKLDNPAILIDEPENKVHILSKEGRKLRDILGKIRQLNLFVGICANSLSDVPSFIYHRLSCIVFIDESHRFWVWDQKKDKPNYTIVDDIKKEFKKVGHAAFKDRKILKRAIIKNMTFSPKIPWDETQYLDIKSKDLFKDIDDFTFDDKTEESKPIPNKIMVDKILKNNPDISGAELGRLLGIDASTGCRLKKSSLATGSRTLNNLMGLVKKEDKAKEGINGV